MIDIHCHLEYMPEPDKIVEEAKQKMTAIIASVADIKDKDKILELRDKNSNFVFVSMGLHPERIAKYSDDELNNYMDFIRANKDKIVAIGEVGLDYLQVKEEDKQRVEDVFIRFISLAKELGLPLVIHSRNVPGDGACINRVIEILDEQKAENVVLHCFSGSDKNLRHALDMGYWISFATLVCKSDKHKRFVKLVPLEKMLLETDSPWIHPTSKEMINRPWLISESVKTISEIKGISAEEILKQTTDNAKLVFGLNV